MAKKTLLFYAYLCAAVLIGCRCARKVRTADDYYIAGRKAGVLQVSGSLLATILGSSAILGSIDFACAKGWAGAWFMLCGAFGLLILIFLSKRLSAFRGYNLPALLGTFHGPVVMRVSAAVIAVAWLGVIGAQLIGAGEITATIFGMPYGQAVTLIGLSVTFYTACGGQFSIIHTDLPQLLILLAGIIVVFLTLAIQSPHLTAQPMLSQDFTPWDLAVMLFTYSSTYIVGPDIYSRLFCARDHSTSRRALLVAALVLLPIAFMLAYIGIYGAHFHAGEGQSVLFAIARSEFPHPLVLLLYFALLSAIISSADTTLFTAAELLSQLFSGELSTARSIRITRGAVVVLGVLSILTALLFKSILTVLLFALSVYSGAFVLPTVWGLMGLRTRREYAIAAIIIGGILALAGKTIGGTLGNVLLLLAFAANLLILFLGNRLAHRPSHPEQ